MATKSQNRRRSPSTSPFLPRKTWSHSIRHAEMLWSSWPPGMDKEAVVKDELISDSGDHLQNAIPKHLRMRNLSLFVLKSHNVVHEWLPAGGARLKLLLRC